MHTIPLTNYLKDEFFFTWETAVMVKVTHTAFLCYEPNLNCITAVTWSEKHQYQVNSINDLHLIPGIYEKPV